MGGGGSKARHMAWIHDLEHKMEVLQLQKQAEIDQLREANYVKMRQLTLEAEQKNLQSSHEHQQKLKAIQSQIRQSELAHEQKMKEYDTEIEKVKEEVKVKLEELGLKGQELQNVFDLEMARFKDKSEERKLRGELMHKLIDQNLSTTDFLVKGLFTTGVAIDAGTLGMVTQMLQAPHNPAILLGERNETRPIENARQSETDDEQDEEATSDMENQPA